MQIFEFHFNPKKKEDLVFDSFVYEPENIYEQKLGNLYMVGELTNALPQNYQFLNSLALTIKNNFYHISAKSSSELSLKNSLKEANKFLEEQEKKGNIDWLGNLNFAQISLKDLNLNFTKVGNIKIILCRERKIMDIGKELEKTFSEAHPLKIFSKIISGKLAHQDKIIILTKEAYELFSKEDFFSEILLIFEKNISLKSTEGEIKNFLDRKKSMLSMISGVFILISLDSAEKITVNIKEPVVLKKKLELKIPGLGIISKIKNNKELPAIPKKILEKLVFYFKKIFKFDFTKIKLTGVSLKEKIKNLISKIRLPGKISFGGTLNFKKILLLVLILIIFSGGFIYLSKGKNKKEITNFQEKLEQIKKRVDEAENALIYRDEKKANSIYQEILTQIDEFLRPENPIAKEFSNIKHSVEKELFALNKTIQNPDLGIIFDFEEKSFYPQKIIISGSNLYFIGNESNKAYSFNLKQKTLNTFDLPEKTKLGAAFKDFPVLLSNSNNLIYLNKKDNFTRQIIENPYSDYDFIDFTAFGSNLYCLESSRKEIIKIAFKESEPKIKGEIWLNPQTKKPDSPLSMAIDGSLWFLNPNQSLSRYYKGEWQEDFNLNFFPFIEKPAKIITQSGFSYLYILNPKKNAIAVLDKTGKLLKQYRFDDLSEMKDFSISNDEKTVYIVNGFKVFEFKL